MWIARGHFYPPLTVPTYRKRIPLISGWYPLHILESLILTIQQIRFTHSRLSFLCFLNLTYLAIQIMTTTIQKTMEAIFTIIGNTPEYVKIPRRHSIIHIKAVNSVCFVSKPDLRFSWSIKQFLLQHIQLGANYSHKEQHLNLSNPI